jgi:DeoR/GlpR family transcriptional regulator of sugar metabolism
MKLLETIFNAQGKVSTAELTKQFKIGRTLLANDLKALEDYGLVERGYGWVMRKAANIESLFFFRGSEYAERAKRNIHEKELIAEYIIENFIAGGKVLELFLDAGSTALEIGKKLVERRIEATRISTNNLPLALYLSNHSSIPCTLVGGEYSHKHACTVGQRAAEAIENFKADLAILTPRGLSVATLPVSDQPELGNATLCFGLHSEDERQHAFKRNLARSCQKLVIALDQSKWQPSGEWFFTLGIARKPRLGPVRTRGSILLLQAATPYKLEEQAMEIDPDALRVITTPNEGSEAPDDMLEMILLIQTELKIQFNEEPDKAVQKYSEYKDLLEAIVLCVGQDERPTNWRAKLEKLEEEERPRV